MDLIVLISLGLGGLAVLGWLIFLTISQSKQNQKLGILFEGEPKSIGDQLKQYAEDVRAVEGHCFKLDKELKKVGKIADEGLHKKGFVRYNPFGDVGGNQSFSLALLDKMDTGYVISSIHSREGTRVYAKSVEAGASEYNLSEEEKKAIKIAVKN
jgi:hypothetical protein